jgi:hypothetical protein
MFAGPELTRFRHKDGMPETQSSFTWFRARNLGEEHRKRRSPKITFHPRPTKTAR